MTAGPYKGLAPFEDSDFDALLFFGRERDRDVIVANLMAARLTVLYGPTGVGKSSILRAGVAHGLRRETGVGVVVFDSWTGDPIAGILEAAHAGQPFVEGLRGAAAEAGGDLYLVLDQFEEYFLYHEEDDGRGTLAWELPELLLRRDVRVNVLLATREDALARLDAFKGRIPNLFGNYLRLDYLDRAGGRAAIVGPVDRWNDLVEPAQPFTVEPGLVEAVLDETAAGKLDIGLAGRGTIEEPQGDARVEAPFLQLVMERLWDAERAAGSATLRLATLRELGGAEAIVRDHLQRALDSLDSAERDVAVSMFDHLVTPSGTKIAHRVSDLEEYAAVGRGELDPVLSTLGRERIVRAVDGAGGDGARYEIFHDVLAEPVLAWKAEHEARRRLDRQREESDKRHRKLLRALALSVVAFVVMAGVTVFALSQRSHARAQARVARARELAATAVSQLQVDPQQSLALGIDSARLKRTSEGEDVLRQALIAARERAILVCHGPVRAVAFSPSGRLVLTAGADGSARLWKQDGTLLRTLGRGRPLAAASFSPDGTLVLTSSADGTARIWRVATGEAIAILRHRGPVTSASFSRNGQLVVTTSEDGTARVWRAANGIPVRVLKLHGPVLTASLSNGGGVVVTVSSDRNGQNLRARLFALPSGRLMRKLPAQGVTVAAFSPNGRLIVTGGEDHTAAVWQVNSGRRLYLFADHQGGVTDALFGPGGRLVATTSSDGATRVRDVRTGVRVALMLGHVNAVNSASFSADGKFLVTTSTDGTARVWEAATGRLETVLRGHTDAVVAAAFSPGGRAVATASADGTARIWDPGTAPELRLLARARQPVRAASFSRDGRLVLTASDDGTAQILSANGKPLHVLDHPDAVESATFSANGTLVLSDDVQRSLRIWRTQTGARVRTARDVSSGPLALSPDGRLLAVPEKTGAIGILTATTLTLEKELRRGRPFTIASFGPDGSLIATAGDDGAARIWQATGTLVRTLTGHTDALTDVSFSPDGRLLVTASRDHDGRIWDVATGRMTALLRGHFGPVFGARFSPDGRWVVTAGPTTAGLWQVANGHLLTYLRGHTEPLTSASFSPDGHQILTSSRDGTVRTYACQICGGINELLALAQRRLTALSRLLSPAERERYLPAMADG